MMKIGCHAGVLRLKDEASGGREIIRLVFHLPTRFFVVPMGLKDDWDSSRMTPLSAFYRQLDKNFRRYWDLGSLQIPFDSIK
jgi:hypothetical protein